MGQLKNLFKDFNNIFGAKENKVIINGADYFLPKDNKSLSSVLNHLRMVKQGKKQFAKLQRLDNGEVEHIHTELLEKVGYEVKINA